jgi:hypothetical protein
MAQHAAEESNTPAVLTCGSACRLLCIDNIPGSARIAFSPPRRGCRFSEFGWFGEFAGPLEGRRPPLRGMGGRAALPNGQKQRSNSWASAEQKGQICRVTKKRKTAEKFIQTGSLRPGARDGCGAVWKGERRRCFCEADRVPGPFTVQKQRQQPTSTVPLQSS